MPLYTLLAVSSVITNAIAQGIDYRIRGADPSIGRHRYTTNPEERKGTKFIVNEKFILHDVDLSFASPWNSRGGSQRGGALISKRHVMFVKHFPLGVGDSISFVSKSGEICLRHIVNTAVVPQSDIMIGLLDYEVTPDINPVKVLPPDYEKYIGTGAGLPFVTLTQQEDVSVSEFSPSFVHPALRRAGGSFPKNTFLQQFNKKLIQGDSGNPAFMIVGNEPILLYCVTNGGQGVGNSVHGYRTGIQQAMELLCPGYSLTSFNFSQMEESLTK